MNDSTGRVLLVISGPIAAGKSTLATALARRLADAHFHAVAIDLDLIVDMVVGSGDFPGDAHAWETARRAAAHLIDGFFEAGSEVVVIEGPFWNRFARPAFEPHLRSNVPPTYITLTVSYETAVERVLQDVANDPHVRPNSRDLVFLKQVHDAFQRRLGDLPRDELVLDSDLLTADELVQSIVQHFDLGDLSIERGGSAPTTDTAVRGSVCASLDNSGMHPTTRRRDVETVQSRLRRRLVAGDPQGRCADEGFEC